MLKIKKNILNKIGLKKEIKEEINCSKIATLPQFGGTCWFNAILMAALYSEASRKVLLNLSKKWDTENMFLMIIRIVIL